MTDVSRINAIYNPQTTARFIEQQWLQRTILTLIVINAVTLGLETVQTVMAVAGDVILLLGKLIVSVFVVEIVLRIHAHRGRFFLRSMELVRLYRHSPCSDAGHRPFRRAARTAGAARNEDSYDCAVNAARSRCVACVRSGALVNRRGAATNFLRLRCDRYKSFQRELSRVVRQHRCFTVHLIPSPVMEVHPAAWLFFVSFILIATFTMLNLFIAIIVNAVQSFTEGEARTTVLAVDEARDHIEKDMHREIRKLRSEIHELKYMLAEPSTSPK